MIKDNLHSKPYSKATIVEAIAPNAPLRWIQLVHAPHIVIDHAPCNLIILGARDIIYFRLGQGR